MIERRQHPRYSVRTMPDRPPYARLILLALGCAALLTGVIWVVTR